LLEGGCLVGGVLTGLSGLFFDNFI
jgi:hypothetical protein